jgi:hypothetical protein
MIPIAANYRQRAIVYRPAGSGHGPGMATGEQNDENGRQRLHIEVYDPN